LTIRNDDASTVFLALGTIGAGSASKYAANCVVGPTAGVATSSVNNPDSAPSAGSAIGAGEVKPCADRVRRVLLQAPTGAHAPDVPPAGADAKGPTAVEAVTAGEFGDASSLTTRTEHCLEDCSRARESVAKAISRR
jgi:hypothetical protein